MIAAVLIDLLVIAAIAAFAWAGWQLGAEASIVRLVASLMAFIVAALLRNPLGSVVHVITGASSDFSRLLAMLLVGVGTYLAMTSITQWWFARRSSRREVNTYDELASDPLSGPRAAAAAGGVLGLCWALMFVAMLVLLPSANPLSGGAIRSQVGGVLIRQRTALQWLTNGFPHYTQTLPKGTTGAILVDDRDEPVKMHMRGLALHPDSGAADELRRDIAGLRTNAPATELVWNRKVAAAAEQHARELFSSDTLATKTSGGQSLATAVLAELGDAGGGYEEEVGVRVVWSHSAENALQALVEDRRSKDLVTDERWTEFGIGVIDGGWFNGEVYVIGLIQRIPSSSTSGSEDFVDEDGDGKPDSIAADPTGAAAP